MSLKIKKKNINHIKNAPEDRIFTIFAYVIVFIIAFLCFYPLWYVIINSFVTGDAARAGVYIFPKLSDIYWGTYQSVFEQGTIFHGMMISGLRVFTTVTLQTLFSAMFAFLVSRPQLPFRKFIYRYAIVTMYVGGGLIPWFIVMRFYGLTNNFATYVVPGLLSVFNVILIKTYMESAIGNDLDDAARIDGAGFVTIFFKIMLPLSKPVLATCALFTAVGVWNTFFDNYLLVQNPRLQTVQMALFNFINQADAMAKAMRNVALGGGSVSRDQIEALRLNMTSSSVRNVSTILAMVPMMLVYPFLQKYFVKGLMLGAIKG